MLSAKPTKDVKKKKEYQSVRADPVYIVICVPVSFYKFTVWALIVGSNGFVP